MEQLTYIRIHSRELAHDDVDEVLEPSREICPSVFQLRTERSKTCEQTFYDVDTKPLEQLGRTVYFVLSSRRIIRNTEDFGECLDSVIHFGVDTKNHAIHKINTESLEHRRHGRIILSERDFRAVLQSQNNITRAILNDRISVLDSFCDNTCQVVTQLRECVLRCLCTKRFTHLLIERKLNGIIENLPFPIRDFKLNRRLGNDLIMFLTHSVCKHIAEISSEVFGNLRTIVDVSQNVITRKP